MQNDSNEDELVTYDEAEDRAAADTELDDLFSYLQYLLGHLSL